MGRGAALLWRTPLTYPCCCAPQAKGQQSLVEKLTKNVGTAIGLELRDTTQQLNATNTKPIKPGMTFNVAVGEVEPPAIFACRSLWRGSLTHMPHPLPPCLARRVGADAQGCRQ